MIVSEGKHSTFTRDRNDLKTSIEVTLKEALLGFEKELTHLDGQKVLINRNTVTQPGFVINLKNQGMPIYQKSGEFGNMYVTVNVKFPTDLTQEQKAAAEQLFLRRSAW